MSSVGVAGEGRWMCAYVADAASRAASTICVWLCVCLCSASTLPLNARALATASPNAHASPSACYHAAPLLGARRNSAYRASFMRCANAAAGVWCRRLADMKAKIMAHWAANGERKRNGSVKRSYQQRSGRQVAEMREKCGRRGEQRALRPHQQRIAPRLAHLHSFAIGAQAPRAGRFYGAYAARVCAYRVYRASRTHVAGTKDVERRATAGDNISSRNVMNHGVTWRSRW